MSGPPAALKHSLHCSFRPIVHLTGHNLGNGVLAPVPELGAGPGARRSGAAALFRLDALPLQGDARKVIHEARFQRGTRQTGPHAERAQERQRRHLRLISALTRGIRRVSSKSPKLQIPL